MPEVSSSQERTEKRLASEFLGNCGYQYRSLKSLSEWSKSGDPAPPSGPDIIVDVHLDGRWQRVGIEITEYQVDSDKHGSRARATHAIWARIDGILRRNYLWRRPGFWALDVYVAMDESSRPPNPDAKNVARQLVAFIGRHHEEVTPASYKAFRRVQGRLGRALSPFSAYPKLQQHVEWIGVRRHGRAWKGGSHWFPADARSVGIVPRESVTSSKRS